MGQSNLAWTPDSIYLVGGCSVYPTPLAIRFWNVDHVMACPTVLPDNTTIRHPDGMFQSESPSKPI